MIHITFLLFLWCYAKAATDNFCYWNFEEIDVWLCVHSHDLKDAMKQNSPLYSIYIDQDVFAV